MTAGPYFRVSPKFWRDVKGWDDKQKLAALYLLTNEHRTTEGLYYLPLGWMQTDLGYAPAAVERLMAFLAQERFVEYDAAAEVVLVRNALKYQAPATPKQIQGAVARLRHVPSTRLWDAFRMACECHCPPLADAIGNASEYSSSSSISSSETPPTPPRGNRRRDVEDFENDCRVFAASVLPSVTEDGVKAVAGAVRGGAGDREQVLVWLRRWRPDLLEPREVA